MSQGSSDEDSEEEEDFAQVQFGSRYTLKHGVGVYVFVSPLHDPVVLWAFPLTVHKHTNLKSKTASTTYCALAKRGLLLTSYYKSLDGGKN